MSIACREVVRGLTIDRFTCHDFTIGALIAGNAERRRWMGRPVRQRIVADRSRRCRHTNSARFGVSTPRGQFAGGSCRAAVAGTVVSAAVGTGEGAPDARSFFDGGRTPAAASIRFPASTLSTSCAKSGNRDVAGVTGGPSSGQSPGRLPPWNDREKVCARKAVSNGLLLAMGAPAPLRPRPHPAEPQWRESEQ